MRLALLASTAFLTFLLPYANLARAEGATPAPVPVTLPAIGVSKVAPRPLTDRIIATGLIAPVEEVRVQPLIEGQPIESLLADLGDRVEAGQVLAVLSKSTLELQKAQSNASLAAAKATVAQAEAQLIEAEASADNSISTAERTKKLQEQGTASQATLDNVTAQSIAATARVSVARQSLEAARAQVTLHEATLANVELQLTRSEVKAPYAGRVLARNATTGAIATAAGAPMFVLEKDGALELYADLSEPDMLRVKAGQTAHLRPVGMGETIGGEVRLVEPAIDAQSRLGRVRIAIDPTEGLRAGQFVEAEIILAQREGLAIPVSALGTAGGQASVLRVDQNGKVEQIMVETGIQDQGWIEILQGLSQGDQIVTKSGAFVRPETHVNPILTPEK